MSKMTTTKAVESRPCKGTAHREGERIVSERDEESCTAEEGRRRQSMPVSERDSENKSVWERSSAVELARWGEVDEVVGVHSPVESVAERGDREGANAEAKRSTSAMARLVLFRMDGRVRLAVSSTEYMMKGREDGGRGASECQRRGKDYIRTGSQ